MSKQKQITLHLTDEEMADISFYLQNKYPWICRENKIYSAELVPVWKVKMGENDAKEIERFIKPCTIKGFDF